MTLCHGFALALMGGYLVVPSPPCRAGDSQSLGGQNSRDSQLRYEVEHEWYEMCPPLTDGGALALNAPFTQWEMLTHWPNREKCDQQRIGAAEIAKPDLSSSDQMARQAATAIQHCRCFSSNDPRLDQNFVRKYKHEGLEQLYLEGLLKRPPN